MDNKIGRKKINQILKTLRLSGIREYYDKLIEIAIKESLSYEELMILLLEKECETRYNNRISRSLKDTIITAAAIERLVHHSVIIELNIESYRMEEAKNKKTEDKFDL